jgi:hypothetical protein
MAWDLLLKSDVGLMSLAVIVLTVVIGGGYMYYFTKKMDEKPGQQ